MRWLASARSLIAMGARRRLRRGPALTWSAITLAASAFVYLIVYLTASERGFASTEDAAKVAFTPIFAIQGVILMFMGTGAVASGIAEERASGVIDYHRLTPMSRASKIVGYLFGLPAREYVLFALTVPFVGYSVIVGGLSPLRIAQLYLVFFTTVVLYHATGMAAGMLSRRPRSAAFIARLVVVVLYVALPNLTALGFSFLAYLTVVPTFRGLLGEELGGRGAAGGALESFAGWQTVPFFTFEVSPTIYTLLMQGLLLASFTILVHRKWRHEATHALSKPYAVLFYAGVQVLVLGSLWPFLAGRGGFGVALEPATVLLALAVYLSLSAALVLVLIQAVTPSRADAMKAWRRAHNLGRTRPHWLADRASSVWVAPVLGAITAVVLVLLAAIAGAGPGLDRPPSRGAIARAAIVFLATACTLQLARELWSSRGFFVFLAGLWIVPGLVALLLLAVWSAYGAAGYLGAFNPVMQYVFVLADGLGGVGVGDATLPPPGVVVASLALAALPPLALTPLLMRAHQARRSSASVALR